MHTTTRAFSSARLRQTLSKHSARKRKKTKFMEDPTLSKSANLVGVPELDTAPIAGDHRAAKGTESLWHAESLKRLEREQGTSLTFPLDLDLAQSDVVPLPNHLFVSKIRAKARRDPAVSDMNRQISCNVVAEVQWFSLFDRHQSGGGASGCAREDFPPTRLETFSVRSFLLTWVKRKWIHFALLVMMVVRARLVFAGDDALRACRHDAETR